MAIQYKISAVDIIKMLGYTEPVSEEEWKEQRRYYERKYGGKLPMDKSRMEIFEEEYHRKFPQILDEFVRLASDRPLFETADIWVFGNLFPYFSYEDIEQWIEDDKEYWEESPEEYEDEEHYQFSKIPREQWKEHVLNYLQIGSDYAAGVVNFGICETDLEKEDPPVYYLHEADSIKDWKVLTNTLSEFLGGIVCDLLAGANYFTAQNVLEEDCWEFCEYKNLDQLSQRQIVLSEMTKYPSFYGDDVFYRICLDKDANTLYLVNNDKDLLVIQKAE